MTVYRVQNNEQRRQKLSSTVENQVVTSAVVSTNNVRIRSGPSVNNSIIANVNKGDRMFILRKNGNWVNVKFKDGKVERTGWVHESLITVNSASSTR